MKPQLPPYLRFRKSDPRYEREIRAYFAGTCQSAWTFLVGAAASNVAHTLVQARKLIEFYRSAVERGQRPGETLFLANLNYRSLAGPALGSILSGSAALEAFLRTLGRAHFEHDLPKGQRGRGASNQVAEQVTQFDERPVCADPPTVGKVNYLFQALLRRGCPTDLGNEIKQLVSFRNEVLHAEPALRTWSGQDQIVRRGRSRRLAYRDGESYPLLWASNRPLSPRHTLRAMRTHDRLVAEFANASEIERLRDEFDLGNDLEFALIERQLRFVAKGDPDHVSAEYGELEQALSAISDHERRQFALDMNRRAMVRPVK